MNKLNFLGIGPKIGVAAIPWLTVAIILSLKYENTFTFIAGGSRILYLSGIVLLTVGVAMYIFTAPFLLKGLRETKLVTGGAFYLCCNPLYSAIILFIFPGVSLLMNSWLVLTTSLVAFTLFKIFIKSEYAEMEKIFGEEYKKYRAETPEFFPFPFKKMGRPA